MVTKVLVVDDHDFIAAWLKAHLRATPDIVCEAVTQHFSRLLDPDDPAWDGVDILVCDLLLDGVTSGVDIIQTVRDYKPEVFTISYTGTSDTVASAALSVAHVVHRKTPAGTDLLMADVVSRAGRPDDDDD